MHSFEVHSNESACRKSGRLGLEQVSITTALHLFSQIGTPSIWTSSPPASRQPATLVSTPRIACLQHSNDMECRKGDILGWNPSIALPGCSPREGGIYCTVPPSHPSYVQCSRLPEGGGALWSDNTTLPARSMTLLLGGV